MVDKHRCQAYNEDQMSWPSGLRPDEDRVVLGESHTIPSSDAVNARLDPPDAFVMGTLFSSKVTPVCASLSACGRHGE